MEKSHSCKYEASTSTTGIVPSFQYFSLVQSEIRELERTRESMAKELVNLTNANLEQTNKLESMEALRKKYRVREPIQN